MSDVTILKPDAVVDRERAEERARQMERRRLAHDYLRAAMTANPAMFEDALISKDQVSGALELADELIAQTEVKS